MSFNEKLQKLRKENKLSQEQLADMLDVTRQSVSKWESGTTYPEMDKLITMCKIFKCSLDDLTNDEITEINLEKKNTNIMNSLVDNILEIIHKSVIMFKSMSFKQTVGCFVTLFFLGVFLLLFKIPFEFIEGEFYAIISYIGRPAIIGFLSGLFNLVLDVIYFALYILVFVYIYKIAYLDKYEFTVGEEKKEQIEVVKEEKEIVREVKIIKDSKNGGNTLFKILGGIVIGFFKFLVGCFSIPFLCTLVVLFALLVIDIYLTFSGVFYLGILLLLTFGIILNIWLLEIVVIFLFNKKASFKRLLWTFIIGISGVGIASGVLTLEIADTEFIDEKPAGFETKKLINEYVMNDNLYFFTDHSYYYDNINYIEDDSITDKVILEIEYYDVVQDVNAYMDGYSINFDIWTSNELFNSKHFVDSFMDSLKKKQIYNYNYLNDITVTVRGSKENLNKIKLNSDVAFDEYWKKIEEENCNANYSYYENEIENYERRITEYETEINEKELEIENLRDQITNLQEYKDRVQGAIGE